MSLPIRNNSKRLDSDAVKSILPIIASLVVNDVSWGRVRKVWLQ